MSATAARRADAEVAGTGRAFRAINGRPYAPKEPPRSLGRPPRLEWIGIGNLMIDPDYQRPITRLGANNIRRIVAGFDWALFAPVLVAPAGGGRFAVVDGQHRVTAAAACGIEKVPCTIIDIGKAQQAAAFAAVNGNITRLHSLGLFHAQVAAGDAAACAIAAAAAAAGVVVAPYPKQVEKLAPNETLAPRAIGRSLGAFGRPATVIALRFIRASERDAPGALNSPIIVATCAVLADHPEWWRGADGGALIAAAAEISVLDLFERAWTGQRRRGVNALDEYQAALIEALEAALGAKRP